MFSSLALLTLVSSSLAQGDAECPDDWFDAGSLGCFKFLEGKVNLTWMEAQLACEQQGGFLAELALLEGSFTGVGFWYIGLTDLGREGDWTWLHSGPDLGDDLWAAH